jgi:CRISPR system Cascade subunit CasD
MQSWGTQSRFSHRDTGRDPSKSGVLGMLLAAQGVDREDDGRLRELAALAMGVRADREGVFTHDYQTVGGGRLAGQRYGVVKASGAAGDPVVSQRFYLADAEFLVALEGDPALLERLAGALTHPVWPLWLGRKAFAPTMPLCLGLHEGTLIEMLAALPWHRRYRQEHAPERLRLVIECAPGEGSMRTDLPLSFANGRRAFVPRHVRIQYVENFPILDPVEEVAPCSSPA